jgi:exopolysaccharide biosynthesis polyprenyl glycosylphosphotransferase
MDFCAKKPLQSLEWNNATRSMALVPRRDYLVLLAGDLVVFTISLWLALFVRALQAPSNDYFLLHLQAFAGLFVAWVFVFFLADLYGKHTRIFRSSLPMTILAAQTINVVLAALMFFAVPGFGIAPKTVLLIYLVISSLLIVLWRVVLYGRRRGGAREPGILVASGPDAAAVAHEVAADDRFRFTFAHIVDGQHVPAEEVVRRACELVDRSDITFLVADFSDPALDGTFATLYQAAFRQRRIELVELNDLYQEVFDRVPLSLVHYEWVLTGLQSSRLYTVAKRAADAALALAAGVLTLPVYPLVMLAIRLEDGGPAFIQQERVGQFRRPIRIVKFRSMTGNDDGRYGGHGRSELRVTRVGRWLRRLRIDELPQLWSILKGDLSFVGPRPELPPLADRYSAQIPFYDARYLVAPGLTGWAQIRHDREPHHEADMAATRTKLSYDLYYLKHRSLILDLLILFQTVRIVLTARGS